MESSGESPSMSIEASAPKKRSGVKLARISSSKYRKASTKKLLGAADLKPNLRKSRSIRLSRQSSRNALRSVARPGIRKDSSVCRPTCSSAIKGSMFIDQCVDGDEPGRVLPKKASPADVCQYSYCSLHGHRHAGLEASPSLKRVKSSRKRFAARSRKSDARLPLGEERSDVIDSSFKGNELDECESKDDHPEPPREVEIPDSRTGVAFSSTIGGRKYTVLWMLIYENMVSDIASETPVRGNVTRETGFVASNDTESESGSTTSTPDEQQMGLCQGDMVKLLQGALDKLLLEQKLNQSPENQSAGDNSNSSRSSSRAELKDEAESGANTPRELQNEEASSNRWSRLRKLILMKRFVKALEKTKRFNPRMQQGQKSGAGHEAEMVNLRRPLIGERKRSEEWMLDYALRDVVSKLDIDQQRRVSLLVEAFEKLSPMQAGNPPPGLDSSSRSGSNRNRQEEMNCWLESGEKSTRNETSPGSLHRNIELSEAEQKNPDASMASQESDVLASDNDSEWIAEESTESDSASANDPETRTSVNATDVGLCLDDGPEDCAENVTGKLVGLDNNLDADDPFGTELGRGKANGLWSLLYAHMVSDIEENSEGRVPSRGTADRRTEDGGDLRGDLNDALKEKAESDRDTAASTPEGQSEICQSDAIKLLQEALGKLLQQQEADQSLSSRSEGGDGTVNGRAGTGISDSGTRASDKPVLSSRWSRLKKLILLKRFVRAVEKAKKLDPKLQRHHQTSEAFTDPETVSLRRQTIEERKRSEEWMLDYALRQAVSKLDQDQKRRVSILVKAFEKMSPNQGSILAIQPNSAAASYGDQPHPDTKQQIACTGSGTEGESLISCAADKQRSTLVSKKDGEWKEQQRSDSYPDSTEASQALDESLERRSDNKRYTRLWYSVYQHMVSGLAAEEGQGNGSGPSDITDTARPCQVSPDQNAEGTELEKIEAVRLVQEAIDGILLSEGEDGSNQLENAKDLQETDNTTIGEKEETEPASNNKLPNRAGAVRNWNNLKKLILIKRFVKSLEKVGKLDKPQQKARRSPLRPEDHVNEEEAEGVSLRRRGAADRKNSEEWMLDYAMRRVVSELTPARKRKVKLLVEAFESVAPPVVGV